MQICNVCFLKRINRLAFLIGDFDLVRAKCLSWEKNYVCFNIGEEACTPDNTAKGQCNLVHYANNIPKAFQYFTTPTLGKELRKIISN